MLFSNCRKVSDNSADDPPTGADGFCSQVSGMFSLVFRAREGFSRSISILLIVALQIYISAVAYKTDYLFTRKVFDWDESRFTQISTVDQGNIRL